jgi:transcription elongation factor GreA-like protein
MRKFIITAELRSLEKQVSLGEISYSKMIEILNEKAEQYHQEKSKELISLWDSLAECGEIKISNNFIEKYKEIKNGEANKGNIS